MQTGLQHAGNLFDPVAQGAPGGGQHPFGHIARQRDDQHRKLRDIDLVHRRFISFRGQIAARIVDLVAHIGQRLVQIGPGLKLHQHIAATLIGGAGHLLDALNRFQRGFQGAQDQPFAVLGRDAFVMDRDIDDRNLDIRFGLFRDGHIGHGARQDQEHQDRQRQPGVANGKFDQLHGCSAF